MESIFIRVQHIFEGIKEGASGLHQQRAIAFQCGKDLKGWPILVLVDLREHLPKAHERTPLEPLECE